MVVVLGAIPASFQLLSASTLTNPPAAQTAVSSVFSFVAPDREQLLERRVIVIFSEPGGVLHAPWTVSLAEHPEWLRSSDDVMGMQDVFDHEKIVASLRDSPPPSLSAAGVVSAASVVRDALGVERAVLTAPPTDGMYFDADAAARAIRHALLANVPQIEVPAFAQEGSIVLDGAVLQPLSSGISSFAKSGLARAGNIRKALAERLDGVVIRRGETLAFNDVLGGDVDGSRGWFMASAIFGSELRAVPGGGICQAATTLFRAVALAGLPVLDRRNHSMYVGYYEEYGIGLDATVYPGEQDFVFRNDTAGDVVIHAYTVGERAVVKLYGVPDGRDVAMQGPFFTTSGVVPALGRTLKTNEIAWVQRVVQADGTIEDRPFVSKYLRGMPRSIAKRYTDGHGKAALLVQAPAL